MGVYKNKNHLIKWIEPWYVVPLWLFIITIAYIFYGAFGLIISNSLLIIKLALYMYINRAPVRKRLKQIKKKE